MTHILLERSYADQLRSHYAAVAVRLHAGVVSQRPESTKVVRSIIRDGIRVSAPKYIEPVARPTPIGRLPPTTSQRIISEAAAKYNVTYGEVIGRSKRKEFVRPRKEAFARLWLETPMSLAAIGRMFKRDHTTVRHGILAHLGCTDLPPKPERRAHG